MKKTVIKILHKDYELQSFFALQFKYVKGGAVQFMRAHATII